MVNLQDQKTLAKSVQHARLLMKHLNALTQSDNPHLARIGNEICRQILPIEERLKRYEFMAKDSDKV